jgi:hypothetical protein
LTRCSASSRSVQGSFEPLPRTIEHGGSLDDRGLSLLVEHGALLVPPQFIGEYYRDERAASEARQRQSELARRYRKAHFASLNKTNWAAIYHHIPPSISFGPADLGLLWEASAG